MCLPSVGPKRRMHAVIAIKSQQSCTISSIYHTTLVKSMYIDGKLNILICHLSKASTQLKFVEGVDLFPKTYHIYIFIYIDE